MRGVRRCVATGLAVAGAALGAFAAQPTAALSADGEPCRPPVTRDGYGKVQHCPIWLPSKGYVPVHALGSGNPVEIGRLDEAGSVNWFICQMRYPSIDYAAPGTSYRNDWWALTVSDDGKKGWVSEVYFNGGDNDQPDAALRVCGSNRAEQQPNNDVQQQPRQFAYRRRSCDSRWMTRASTQGGGSDFVASMWPTRRARLETVATWFASGVAPDPDAATTHAVLRSMNRVWRSMWRDLQHCLGFASNRNFALRARHRRSLYQQLACHALYAVHEQVGGGPTWDLEASQLEVSWSKIYNPRAVWDHECNWDK